MAFQRAIVVSLLLSLLLSHFTEANQMGDNGAESPQPQTINCAAACRVRCKESSRPNLCKRACGTCCARCKCVPPRTSGNYEACPCYFNLTTHNNIRKCP